MTGPFTVNLHLLLWGQVGFCGTDRAFRHVTPTGVRLGVIVRHRLPKAPHNRHHFLRDGSILYRRLPRFTVTLRRFVNTTFQTVRR